VTAIAAASLLVPPAPPAAAQPAEKEFTNSFGMKLVLIPAGKFAMGSPDKEADRDPEELQHEVVIAKPFYMGVHEVTQAQFQKSPGKFFRARFTAAKGGGPDHPMEGVSWNDAAAFCQRLSQLPEEKKAGRTYRLPTEAEWEYACRAGTTTALHFGDALSAKDANFNGNYPYGGAAKGPYLRRTAKVGSYAPNAWGLYDMHGNVAEWCSDFYDPDYYKNSPKQDPKGPEKGVLDTGFKTFFRVARGGCWLDEGRGCRAAYRWRLQPTEPYQWVGFRVVCEVGRARP
jgi:formylglycine-generating enzyme required for sulfatase activity